MRKILIDCTLTGGRGPAKKVYEFVMECKKNNTPYKIITDKKLVTVLKDFGIVPDFVVDVTVADPNERIYEEFKRVLTTIRFDVLIKFGARTAGPYVARLQNKPYIIIDGGLPDKYESYPSLYDKLTYEKALAFIVTTNFPYRPSPPRFMRNVKVAYFPLSSNTCFNIEKVINTERKDLFAKLEKFLTSFTPDAKYTINLSMTNDYVEPFSRKTYGAWLTSDQFDQCVGFIRRLITDLGESKQKINLVADTSVIEVGLDLFKKYANLQPVSWKNKWNYQAEYIVDAISDISIARAANYQPFIFALSRGNSITSAVPAGGYMDEDRAAVQADALGLTTNIPFDDEDYTAQLLDFANDSNRQKKMAITQRENYQTFGKQQNSIDMLLRLISNI